MRIDLGNIFNRSFAFGSVTCIAILLIARTAMNYYRRTSSSSLKNNKIKLIQEKSDPQKVKKLKTLIKNPNDTDFSKIIFGASCVDLREAIEGTKEVPQKFTDKFFTLKIPDIEKKFGTLCNQWPSLANSDNYRIGFGFWQHDPKKQALKAGAFPYVTNAAALKHYSDIDKEEIINALRKISDPHKRSIWLKSLTWINKFKTPVHDAIIKTLNSYAYDYTLQGNPIPKEYLEILSLLWIPPENRWGRVDQHVKWIPLLLKNGGARFLKKVRLENIVLAADYMADKSAYLGKWFNDKINSCKDNDLKTLKLTRQLYFAFSEKKTSITSIQKIIQAQSVQNKLNHRAKIIRCCEYRPDIKTIQGMLDKTTLNNQLKKEFNELGTNDKKISFLGALSDKQLKIVYEKKHMTILEKVLEGRGNNYILKYKTIIELLAEDKSVFLGTWAEKKINKSKNLEELDLNDIKLYLKVKNLPAKSIAKILNAQSTSIKLTRRKEILEDAKGHPQITQIRTMLNETTLNNQLKKEFNELGTNDKKIKFLKDLPAEQLKTVYAAEHIDQFKILFKMHHEDWCQATAIAILKLLSPNIRIQLLSKVNTHLDQYLLTLTTQQEFTKLKSKFTKNVLGKVFEDRTVDDSWLKNCAVAVPTILTKAIQSSYQKINYKRRLADIQKKHNLEFDQSLADLLNEQSSSDDY